MLVGVEAPTVSQPADRPPPVPIRPRTWPLSRSPRSYPRLTAAQRAGELPSAAAVTAWRDQATRLPAQPATPSRSVGDAGQAGAATDTIEAVILRRGSTRRFARHPMPHGALRWAMANATRPVPGDFIHPTGSDAAGAPGGRARGGWADARGLPVQPGRFPAAPRRGRAAPHPRAVPGAGPWRRFGRDRLSLRPPGAHPAGPGRTRLPGPPSWRAASPRSGCNWRRSRSALAPPGSPSWTTTSRRSSAPTPHRCWPSRSAPPPIGHGPASARPSCRTLAWRSADSAGHVPQPSPRIQHAGSRLRRVLAFRGRLRPCEGTSTIHWAEALSLLQAAEWPGAFEPRQLLVGLEYAVVLHQLRAGDPIGPVPGPPACPAEPATRGRG